MFKVEELSQKISDKISEELNYDKEKASIINYGVFSFLQIIISIISVMIFGLIFNLLIESLIISFTISILRKSSGGAHASTAEKCLIIGTLSSIFFAMIAKIGVISYQYTLYIGAVIFIVAYFLIVKLAPVDSTNKPIKSEKKKKRLKRGSILIVTIYLIIVIISLSLYKTFENEKVLVYLNCIYIGLLWQVFSLTRLGHKVSNRLDTLL